MHPTSIRHRASRPATLVLALAALVLAPLACSGDDGTGTPRDPLVRVATIESPNGAEGAAVVELAGDVAADVTADDGSEAFADAALGVTRVVIVRGSPGAHRFRLRLPAGATPPTARVIEVADGSDRLRASVSGYSVRFEQ